MIGRKTTVGKRDYEQIMVYVPTHLAGDSNFTALFPVGQPVELDLDIQKKLVTMKPIAEDMARRKGWVRRTPNKRK